jgi:hypothetical protein
MTADEAIEDYLEQPPEHRVEWAENVLASIEQDGGLSLGAQIEQSCGVMEQLHEAEPSDEIRKKLRPLLDETNRAMSNMMRDLAQENP